MILGAALITVATACGGNDSQLPQVERGNAIYASNCQSCHGDVATGDGGLPEAPVHGPSGHTWHHADGQLADIVLGRFDYPGKTMPSFDGLLSEEEVSHVLAYFKTGWERDQVEFQEQVSKNWGAVQGGQ
ncbi:MAG: cytochrome c [Chloroflexi bacterium]|nr:cytochrome c [Chloroflexota bacterium]